MQNSQPEIDVIFDILKFMQKAKPGSEFINSLYLQYCERGSLSKKQLEGLHNIASKEAEVNPGKLATLEAIIRKKVTRHRSALPENNLVPETDEKAGQMIIDLLQKFPSHKRVLYLQALYEKNKLLPINDRAELEKFYKLLIG